MTALAPTLQAFFTERLIRRRRASPHTIAAYRDTLRMLLIFAADQTKVAPSELDLTHLDAPLIAAFLDHLEIDRGNAVRTRNARLAAIHSLLRFAAPRHPEHAASIARALAIPSKRCDRALVTYLTEPEVQALLAACDQQTWTGRRDHALLLLAVQTGLRISELMPSNTGSLFTPARLAAATPACCTRRRQPTRCGTPPPCACCTPVSTPVSSPSGSDTNRSTPRRSTYTPTSPSKKQQSQGPDQ